MLKSRFRAGAAAMALASAAMPFAATPASAQVESGGDIRIEAGPLSETLRRISERTGTAITVDEAAVAGERSPAIAARTARAAILQAIAGLRLTLLETPSNGLAVTPLDGGDIVVTATRDEAELDYLVRNADSSTRDGLSLREQPQSTTVISDRLIRDQQVQTVAEALRNASGATVNLGNVQGLPSFTVRGFFAQPLSGGLRDPAALVQPVANVERIEVLKGPAALLSGADNLGGGVNIVTKRPSAQTILTTTAEYATFDDRRLVLDASTAFNDERTVSARLVAQYAQADRNVAGYDGRFEHFVAPSIRYKNASVDVTIGAELNDTRLPSPPWAGFTSTGRLLFFAQQPFGPTEQGFETQSTRFYYGAEVRAADWLTLVSQSQYREADIQARTFAFAQSFTPVFQLFLRTSNEQRNSAIASDNYARLRFSTFGAAHRLTAGFNYSDLETSQFNPLTGSSQFIYDVNTQRLLNANSLAPIAFPPFLDAVAFANTSSGRQHGYYVQDVIELGPVHLLGALRENRFTSLSQVGTGAQTRRQVRQLTPQAGIVLDVTRDLSLFANYIEGFQPNFLLDVNDQLLPPQESANLEIGAKWDLFGDALGINASVFRNRQINIAAAVVGRPNRFTTIPGQESKGAEIDVTGRITRSLNVAASYAYMEAEPLQPTLVNAVVPGQPRHRYSLFARYDLPSGALRGLGLGAGVYGFSRSFLGTRGLFELEPQTQVDLNIYHKVNRLTINLGVQNLLDDTLYGVSRFETYIPVNPRRTVRLTLTYDWS